MVSGDHPARVLGRPLQDGFAPFGSRFSSKKTPGSISSAAYNVLRNLLPNGQVCKHSLYTLLLKCQVGSQVSNYCGQDLGGGPNRALAHPALPTICSPERWWLLVHLWIIFSTQWHFLCLLVLVLNSNPNERMELHFVNARILQIGRAR